MKKLSNRLKNSERRFKEMTINNKGDVIDRILSSSVIKTTKRLSYEKCNDVLTNGISNNPDYQVCYDSLLLMVELKNILKEKRYRRGSIDFDIDEVKIILDDYQEELMSVAKDIKLSDKSINEYKFNPKKLSNALYGTPRYWHVILRINGLASVHDFSLSKKTVKLLEPNDMKNIIGQIYSTEKKSIIAYNNAHDNMIIETPVNKYVYVKDASKKFDTL